MAKGGREGGREREDCHHHMGSCAILLALPLSSQWWGSSECSSGGAPITQFEPGYPDKYMLLS